MMSRPFWEGNGGALLGAGVGGVWVCCSISFCGSSVLIVALGASTPRRRVGVVERDIMLTALRPQGRGNPGIVISSEGCWLVPVWLGAGPHTGDPIIGELAQGRRHPGPRDPLL